MNILNELNELKKLQLFKFILNYFVIQIYDKINPDFCENVINCDN